MVMYIKLFDDDAVAGGELGAAAARLAGAAPLGDGASHASRAVSVTTQA